MAMNGVREERKIVAEGGIEVERAILGSILLVNDLWKQASILPESAFALNAHRLIFRAVRSLAEASQPIDEFTVVEELRRRGELDRVGAAYVTSLTDGAVVRSDISFMLASVIEATARRRAAKAGEQLQHLAADSTVSMTALMETAAGLIDECSEPPDAPPPRHSEEALALRFSRTYANDLRYVVAWGSWFFWDGACWRQDETLSVLDRVRSVCRLASSECSVHEKGIAVRLAGGATVYSVERLARSDRRHATLARHWDANPWLLNTPSGTVDLSTGELRPNRREDLLTKLTAASSGGDCPTWLRFLDRITGGSTELQCFLQRVVGYCLTGLTREHAIFFLYGTGANGKSVFLSTISGLLNDYAKTAPMSAFTANSTDQHPTELAALRGARLVTAIETEDGARWAESRIKSLTGGDKVAARFMRQDFFEFVPEFKLVVAGNHKPGLRSVDESIRRRLHLVPLTVTIPIDERDPELVEKLKNEYPGILQWAIEGCLDWQSKGLDAPEIVRNATAEYLETEDAVGRWLDERCEVDTGHWTASGALFSDWRSWCAANGEQVGNHKRFTQAVQVRGFRLHKTREARGFSGIVLKSELSVARVARQSISDVTRAGVRPI
jgi:putative DNA primase/helicase